MLNFSKAFDTIQTCIFLKKNIRRITLKLIESYLTIRQQFVTINQPLKPSLGVYHSDQYWVYYFSGFALMTCPMFLIGYSLSYLHTIQASSLKVIILKKLLNFLIPNLHFSKGLLSVNTIFLLYSLACSQQINI